MQRIIVYTAIANNKDDLKPVILPVVPYVAFIDNTIKPLYGWAIKELKPISDNSRLNAKVYKILPHKFLDCDVSLWMDGTYTLLTDPRDLVKNYLAEHDIAFCKHPYYDDIYDEGESVIRWKLDKAKIVKKQMEKYRKEGYPDSNGLVSGGFILRRHTAKVKKTMEDWWNEIQNHSIRDQLSFNYVAWKNGLKYACFPCKSYIGGKAFYHPFFRYTPHKDKR